MRSEGVFLFFFLNTSPLLLPRVALSSLPPGRGLRLGGTIWVDFFGRISTIWVDFFGRIRIFRSIFGRIWSIFGGFGQFFSVGFEEFGRLLEEFGQLLGGFGQVFRSDLVDFGQFLGDFLF